MKKTLLAALLLIAMLVTVLSACDYLPFLDDYIDSGKDNNKNDKDDDDEDRTPVYTVKFDSNGGTKVPSQKVEEGGKITEPETPVREGYIFDGWYLNSTKISFDTYEVTKRITLTAHWISEEEFNGIYP